MLEQLCRREREKWGTRMCFDSFISGGVLKRQGSIPDYLCAWASNYCESQQDIMLFCLCLPLLVYYSSFSPGFQLLFFFGVGREGSTSSLSLLSSPRSSPLFSCPVSTLAICFPHILYVAERQNPTRHHCAISQAVRNSVLSFEIVPDGFCHECWKGQKPPKC